MPNHIRTIVKFKHLKSDDIIMILNMIASQLEDGTYVIDFNKIIPEPQDITDCPEDFILTKSEPISVDEDRPWFNWYRWRLTNWGTKWCAYDGYTLIGKSWITFVFSTAWSFAYPVIKKLDLMGYELDIKYADEDIGSNCGKLSFTSEQGWTMEDESKLKDPVRFARNLWNKY